MPHEYDFFTWLRHISEAQKRADEKTSEASSRESMDRPAPPEDRSLLRAVWGPYKEPVWPHEDRSQLEGIESSGGECETRTYDLRALLEMLGEE